MPKIIIEVEEDLKWRFVTKCATVKKKQKEVLTEWIKKWLKRK